MHLGQELSLLSTTVLFLQQRALRFLVLQKLLRYQALIFASKVAQVAKVEIM
jgi:hypothetical protein